jgi:dTDP-4-dehydrorhamnose 3,5-epimerase
MVWIPEGFGHGFAALTETVALSYKVTEYYSPKAERCVLWNDPELGIDWKIAREDAILSAKDAAGVPFAQAEVFA